MDSPKDTDRPAMDDTDGKDDTVGDDTVVSPAVVEEIAPRAARAVAGVHDVRLTPEFRPKDGLARDLHPIRRRSRGIRAEIDEGTARFDIAIVAKLATPLEGIAKEVRAAVRRDVRALTGLKDAAVRVRVVGVHDPAEATATPTEQPPAKRRHPSSDQRPA